MESILIVDDDLNLCTALKDELIEVGYDAQYVTNGFDAIKHLQNNEVNLVLLDLKMPDMDGFDVLRKMEEKDINTKVIVLTAYADVKSAIDSAKMGVSDFISKPYDFDELLITIRRVLQRE